MKRAVIGLILLLFLAGAGFGWYIHAATVERTRLETELSGTRAKLQESIKETERLTEEVLAANTKLQACNDEVAAIGKRVEGLLGDIASEKAKSADLSTRIAQAASEAAASLAASNDRASKLEQDLVAARAALQATAQSNAANEQAKTKLAEFQRRLLACNVEAGDKTRAAIAKVQSAEQSLYTAPSKAASEELGRELVALKAQCEGGIRSIAELHEYVTQSEADLRDARSSVNEALGRCDTIRAGLVKFKTHVDECIAARREASYDVQARDDWKGPSVTLADNEAIALSASGSWVYAHFAALSRSGVGPQGENGAPAYRIADQFNNGCLLLRVRGSDVGYPGWSSARPPRGGAVEFRINDSSLGDNSGWMRVTMWVFLPIDSK